MKIALAQLNYCIGDFSSNIDKIISVLNDEKERGTDLVVFAEMSVCGYLPNDFLNYNQFVIKCQESIEQIAQHAVGIACIVGAPEVNPILEGKDLYNSAFFFEEGAVKQVVRKSLLPTYDIFDEYRYFESAVDFKCIEFKGYKIAVTICEDLWNLGNNPLYKSCPMDELIKEEPDFMINIAASPFDYKHEEQRLMILSQNSRKYQLPLLYVNQVGANTDLIFDGGSLVFDKAGDIVAELAYFKEDVQVFNIEQLRSSIVLGEKSIQKERVGQVYEALVLGIRDYFHKSGFRTATLGLSGGIDSAVVCALAVEALGAENVFPVLLPSKYSSDHSIKDAIDLANNLGCQYTTIPITKITESFEESLADEFAGLPQNLAEENIQARTRGVLLMAFSNKFGHILLNTSNKSECAVGYGTLYGDMCGAISVIGDCYKTQVYKLADYINREREIIPKNTITKAPSAELRPDQKDSDSLPEYDLLDEILLEYIEMQKSADEIIEAGFDSPVVHRVTNLVNKAEFKRFQTAPILRISPKSFGIGRRMPIVAKYKF
ncbi:NH(3)-dependent NAD(+) synthetase [Pseudopedobacter saltans DSM 12145]|uniref:Glutamine-dependent NAD(+) synthetase n=1 Tax=Pseudopedobacter saltans (strain ATCC 51119 / DSM 12145 / JCM 21818 / CCUG 39354 / LMG 10337 / NBRC 100064 / NCIMB 13643) TaxID=762903 RepID=F0SEX7_PSESL|nr:NAD+ synthase [Pseudopedobacter saltans]ADY53043.1 NH(3)-dependent NAD(+) synthetase [Pseudopedobacter saltans DSM 12145]